MDSQSSKHPSSRRNRDRERERKKRKEKDRDVHSSRHRDRDRDRDRNRHDRPRKYDFVFDEEDDWAYRRRPRYEQHVARKVPWVSQVDWDSCHNVAEMQAFVKYMSPTPVEEEIRGLVIKLVSNAITSAFPDAQILPFGSYETKLYLPSGDIDLVIDSHSMAYSNKINVLHALANTLKRAKITSKVTYPIVKFVTNFGRLNVDISVNQGNGVKAGQIINGFLNDMQGFGFALRCLVMIAKAFLNQRGMNEVYTGGVGSYSIVCLAVSFPADASQNTQRRDRRGEEPWRACYGVFRALRLLLQLRRGWDISEDGGSYFSKRQRGWYDFMKGHLLSIEDPNDPTNDISKGSYGINKVRQTLAGAYGIMQATGRSHPLRKETNPEDLSILSSILGVTQETINNRLLLQEVYDKRLLHQLLGVSPQASVVAADVPANHQSQEMSLRGASSVQEAWDEVDTVPESDDNHRDHVTKYEDSDETGRYHIQERRRRREDEEEMSEDELEHRAYDIESDDERRSRMSRRRSYWLSKGIGPEQTSQGDDGDSG
ncbi:hypothetical protein BU15DRAFT_87016 [Melanogaster broomeanus]|nr:hypothetical protein BU15DRAFT_87016 [Melanogaster broomeanus]